MGTSVALRYRTVDVFTERVLEGNPLAVFPNAPALPDATMQRIARELNLSETVFVLPPTRSDCAARLRIFTPSKELPFAGHPTIGTAFVLLDEGITGAKDGQLLLEEGVGPVGVRLDAGAKPMLWLTTPPIEPGRFFDARLCADVLGLSAADLLDAPPRLLSAGNPTVFVAVRAKAAVDRAWIDLSGTTRLRSGDEPPFCVFVFTPTAEGAYSRMFAPDYGISEDPATGSSTGPLAHFMIEHRLLRTPDETRFVSEQGTKMGRRSYLHVRVRTENGSGTIEVGGHVTPVAEATMRLDADACRGDAD